MRFGGIAGRRAVGQGTYLPAVMVALAGRQSFD
jgi:hypothetical protein